MTREEFKRKWKEARKEGSQAEADLILGIVQDGVEAPPKKEKVLPNQLELPLKKGK